MVTGYRHRPTPFIVGESPTGFHGCDPLSGHGGNGRADVAEHKFLFPLRSPHCHGDDTYSGIAAEPFLQDSQAFFLRFHGNHSGPKLQIQCRHVPHVGADIENEIALFDQGLVESERLTMRQALSCLLEKRSGSGMESQYISFPVSERNRGISQVLFFAMSPQPRGSSAPSVTTSWSRALISSDSKRNCPTICRSSGESLE